MYCIYWPKKILDYMKYHVGPKIIMHEQNCSVVKIYNWTSFWSQNIRQTFAVITAKIFYIFPKKISLSYRRDNDCFMFLLRDLVQLSV